METDAAIVARCTVHYRVCMEEEWITWQDCGRAGCGPSEVITREQTQAHALATIPSPVAQTDRASLSESEGQVFNSPRDYQIHGGHDDTGRVA